MGEEKKKAPPANETDEREEQQARRRHWLRVRRRFVGAGAVFLFIGLLWQLGEDARAPQIAPAPLPDTALSPVQPDAELQAVEDFYADTEEWTDGENTETAVINEPDAEPPADAATDGAEETENTAGDVADELAPPQEPPQQEPPAAEEPAAPSSSDAAKPAASDGGYAVKIGAFTAFDRGRRAENKLRAHNFLTETEEAVIEGVPFLRVFVVGYRTRAEAVAAQQKIEELGYKETKVYDRR